MRLRDVMTARPVVVSPRDTPEEIERLMAAARVHHLPLLREGRLAGLWTATDEGQVVLLGPESVYETTPDADADGAICALFAGREAVLAWEGGVPAGLLTRSDVLDIVRAAVAHGIGRRRPRPVVVRLVGPAGAGKSTLVARTVARLRRIDVGVVRATGPGGEDGPPVDGAPVIEAPEAHWRAGLAEAVRSLGDRQLVLVEDDGPARPGPGIGEDLQVLVVPAADAAAIDPAALRDAQALVLTKVDALPEGRDADAERRRVQAGAPHLAIFALAPGRDDRGLDDWRAWIEAQVLPRGR